MPFGRRQFLRASATGVATAALTPAFWRWAHAQPGQRGTSPYGPLGEPDSNGIRLPEGFSSRVVARANQQVEGSTYPWHIFPDGGATYPTEDGGWIYVSNSEVPTPQGGGVGTIVFGPDGTIVDAYSILSNTRMNCSGGATPWGTWLSCEEFAGGRVWECDPSGNEDAVVRPALGTFQHEAASVDPDGQQLYLTEDTGDGGFYRFTPDSYPDLSSGTLEIASVSGFEGAQAEGGGRVSWIEVPEPNSTDPATKDQVAGATAFDGGEGTGCHAGVVYFATKGTHRVWIYELLSQRLEIVYDADALDDPPVFGVDNVHVAANGDIYVAEDPADEDSGGLVMMLITPERVVGPFLELVGHGGSELAGPAFNPDGDRFYFSSQRGGPFGGVNDDQPGSGFGVTYEITGPFRQRAQGEPTPSPSETFAGAASPSPTPSAGSGSGGVSQDDGGGADTGAGQITGDNGLPVTGGGAAAAGLGALAAGAAGAGALRSRRSEEQRAAEAAGDTDERD